MWILKTIEFHEMEAFSNGKWIFFGLLSYTIPYIEAVSIEETS